MKRSITCIVCPKGCVMEADIHGDQIKVIGNSCPRGEKHAIDEILHPTRTLTSVIRVSNRTDTMVSVKSAQPVPKDKLFEIMDLIHTTAVRAPIAIGDVLIPDVYGTQIVATKEIE